MQTTIRMGKITILLVDDHKLIRDSWSFILNSDSRFQVIGETSNADEAVEISKDKKPEIVLMDINMVLTVLSSCANIHPVQK